MYQVPLAGALKVQTSLLPFLYGRQSYVLVVDCEPWRTYKSASPVPPESVTVNVE